MEWVARQASSLGLVIKKGFDILRRHPHIVWMSVVNTIVVLIFSYWLHSCVFSFGGDLKAGQWIDRLSRVCKSDFDYKSDSIIFVNIAYDKVLKPYNALLDETEVMCTTRDYVGSDAMTDRAKLLKFLNELDSVDYRYILLDIRFDKGFENDSISKALFRKIIETKRIVVARHNDCELADSTLISKTALADYHTTFLEAGLVKYPTIYGDDKTLPGKIYEDLYCREIKNYRLFCTDNGHLCYGSIFLTYPVRIQTWQCRKESTETYVRMYENLGTGILDSGHPIDYAAMFSGKIIVIGDLINDTHETYVGTLPGAVVNVNTYIALSRGAHIVKWWWVLFLSMVYMAIFLSIFAHKNIFDYIPRIRSSKSVVTRFVVSLLGYSIMLLILSCLYYICMGDFYSIAFPAIYFSMLSTIVKYRGMKKQRL